MKKIILTLSIISLIPSIALANESKSGVYVSAKMGASIQQMKGQFYPTFYTLEIGGDEVTFEKN